MAPEPEITIEELRQRNSMSPDDGMSIEELRQRAAFPDRQPLDEVQPTGIPVPTEMNYAAAAPVFNMLSERVPIEVLENIGSLGRDPIPGINDYLGAGLQVAAAPITEPAAMAGAALQGIYDAPLNYPQVPQSFADQGPMQTLAKSVLDPISKYGIGYPTKVPAGINLAIDRAVEPIVDAYNTGALDPTGLAARYTSEYITGKLADFAEKGSPVLRLPTRAVRPVAQAIAGELADAISTGEYSDFTQYPERALETWRRFLEIAGPSWFKQRLPKKAGEIKESISDYAAKQGRQATEEAQATLIGTKKPAGIRKQLGGKLIKVENATENLDDFSVKQVLQYPVLMQPIIKNQMDAAVQWAAKDLNWFDNLESGEDLWARHTLQKQQRYDLRDQIIKKAKMRPDAAIKGKAVIPPGAKEYALRRAMERQRTIEADTFIGPVPKPEAFKDVLDFVDDKTITYAGVDGAADAKKRVDFIMDAVFGQADKKALDAAIDARYLSVDDAQKIAGYNVERFAGWVPDRSKGPEGRIYETYLKEPTLSKGQYTLRVGKQGQELIERKPPSVVTGKEKAAVTALQKKMLSEAVTDVPTPYVADLPTVYQLIKRQDELGRDFFRQGMTSADAALEASLGQALRKQATLLEDDLVKRGVLTAQEVTDLRKVRTELHYLTLLDHPASIAMSTAKASKNTAEATYSLSGNSRNLKKETYSVPMADPNRGYLPKLATAANNLIGRTPFVGEAIQKGNQVVQPYLESVLKSAKKGITATAPFVQQSGAARREYEALPNEPQFPRSSTRFFNLSPDVLTEAFPSEQKLITDAFKSGPAQRTEALRQLAKAYPDQFENNPMGIVGYSFVDGKVDPDQAPILRKNLYKMMNQEGIDKRALSRLINAVNGDEAIITNDNSPPTAAERTAVAKSIEDYLINMAED